MNFSGVTVGELAALASAVFWALGAVVYRWAGQRLAPLVLNVLKGTIAIVLLWLTILLQGASVPQMTVLGLAGLLLSGVIGIGFGDTAYLQALKYLGPRQVLLLGTLSPPLTAILASLILGEVLTGRDGLGIAITIAGVAWVITERTAPLSVPQSVPPSTDAPQKAIASRFSSPVSNQTLGIICGLLAALGQSIGAILSRAVLSQTSIPPLWAALLRLLAGVGVILPWVLVQRSMVPTSWQILRHSRKLALGIGIAAFLGTYLGIWLQQTSLKFTTAGIAQTLSATNPLFVLPIVAFLGEKVSIRAVLGAIVALMGIWILLGS